MSGDTIQAALDFIQVQAQAENVRLTQHAQQEMAEDGVTLADVLSAVIDGMLVEHYPQHRRGACCLIAGPTVSGEALHVVCTCDRPVLIIITVYLPRPPEWISPLERGRS